MQIVQQPELNRHLGGFFIPLTWEKRWKLLRCLVPVMVILFTLEVNVVLWSSWMHDDNPFYHLPKILGVPFLCLAILLIGAELQIQAVRRMKRTMKFGNQGIALNGAKITTVRWTRLTNWWLEPVPSEAGLRKLTLQYARDKKGRRNHSWSIVLRQPEQTDALKSELQRLRQTGLNLPAINEQQSAPILEWPVKSANGRGVWAMGLALLLLMNGLPLLVAGFSSVEGYFPVLSDPAAISVAPNSFQKTITRIFSSRQQSGRFLMIVGCSSTLFGGVCYFYGLRSVQKIKAPSKKGPESP